MALSEQERRLLEEMERNFYSSEADIVDTSQKRRPSINYRFLALGVLIVVLGIGVLIASVVFTLIWLGVLGFIVMLLGVTRCVSVQSVSGGKSGRAGVGAGARERKSAKSGKSFMERLERRWEERMRGQQ